MRTAEDLPTDRNVFMQNAREGHFCESEPFGGQLMEPSGGPRKQGSSAVTGQQVGLRRVGEPI